MVKNKVNNKKNKWVYKIPFKELIVIIAIIVGVVVFYGNTLFNGFIHDDVGQIEQNVYVHSLAYLPKVITGCIWESALNGCKGTTNYYRPMQSLSYLLTYQISPKPWIFHLVNMIFFSINVFLVFLLIKLLTKNFTVAIFTSFIFLIHPVNSSVVNWIAAQPELLYCAFALLSTIFYYLFRERNNPQLLKFVYIFFALGILSKEPAVFTPVLFLLLDLTYFKQKIKSLLSWQYIKFYLILGLILSVYVVLRIWVLGTLIADPSNTDADVMALSYWQRIFDSFYLIVLYLQKFFLPLNLQFFYAPEPILSVSGIVIPAILTSLAYLGLIITAWRKKWTNMFFGLFWFILFLIPNLIFLHVANVFAERYLFVPSAGIALIVALLLNRLWINGQKGQITISILFTAAAISSWMIVYPWNKVWVNDFSIYNDTLKKNPKDDLISYDLGVEYMQTGKSDLAKELLTKVVERGTWKGIYKAYNNLGELYRREGNSNQAIKYFQEAIKANPNHISAYNNLGALSLENGDYLQSVTNLCKAVLIDPSFKDANNNFNIASSRVQGLDDQAFTSLIDQLLHGSLFKSSYAKDQISFKSKNCSYQQGCILIFSSKLPKNVLIFPYLIAGKTATGEMVRARYFEINPDTNDIALGIDHQFEKSGIQFTFPTCDKFYYQSSIPPQN